MKKKTTVGTTVRFNLIFSFFFFVPQTAKNGSCLLKDVIWLLQWGADFH